MPLILNSEEEEGDPPQLLGCLWRGALPVVRKAGKRWLFSLPIPFVKIWADLDAVPSEGLDEVARFRAGQKYRT